MITDVGIHVDLKPFLSDLERASWDDKNRCSLNKPTGNWLYDPYEFLPDWKNTSFERFLNFLPFPIGEARLIKLSHGECYHSHADIDDRYHLNLTSNDGCFLLELDGNQIHAFPIKSDGILYRMDAGKIHTAVNFGSSDRIQLVVRVPLIRSNFDNLESITIEFLDKLTDLRFKIDNSIMPILNRLNKIHRIADFSSISETAFSLRIEKYYIPQIIAAIDQLGLTYKILR